MSPSEMAVALKYIATELKWNVLSYIETPLSGELKHQFLLEEVCSSTRKEGPMVSPKRIRKRCQRWAREQRLLKIAPQYILELKPLLRASRRLGNFNPEQLLTGLRLQRRFNASLFRTHTR